MKYNLELMQQKINERLQKAIEQLKKENKDGN